MVSVTRSQTGKTPKKPDNFPGLIDTSAISKPRFRNTPGNSRKSTPALGDDSLKVKREEPTEEEKLFGAKSSKVLTETEDNSVEMAEHASSVISAKSNATDVAVEKKDGAKVINYKIDDSGVKEFGGSLGTFFAMFFFPFLMWYLWIGQVHYNAQLPLPEKGESMTRFWWKMVGYVIEGATPTWKAWAIYWGFFFWQAVLYVTLPGVLAKGSPMPHRGSQRLDYYCNAVWSLYATLTTVAMLHITKVFPLYTILDEFGPLLSVSILSGIAVSFIAYFSALWRGAEHRMTGSFIYDFFMGAELNPRIGLLDFKMFFEVRLPWYILLLISCAAAARQYELYGYVTAQVMFCVMVHWFYANACSKGEELIVTTWDMTHEKWGFMLIFWNMAGVPLTYCHGTLYLANQDPSKYKLPAWFIASLYLTYIFAYWVWDSCNSQKNRFRQQEQGTVMLRKTFPQVPWQTIKNPTFIKCRNGGTLLTSGWYGLARKIHYTADMVQLTCWGLITGFKSPLPYFLPVFFLVMILHRVGRDIHRCSQKYGEDWEEYKRQVPALFIPYVF